MSKGKNGGAADPGLFEAAPQTPAPPSAPWQPTRFQRLIKVLESSTRTAHVVTDAGRAYLKAPSNPEGPHVLAADLIGTRLAALIGLPTADCATLVLEPADVDAFPADVRPKPGRFFASRDVGGRPWAGTEEDLDEIANPNDLAGLVVLDTWTRNCDRYSVALTQTRRNIRNVLFAEQGAPKGKFRVIALDQGCCFTCGGTLHKKLAHIDTVKDTRLYGLFPEFARLVTREAVAPFTKRLGDLRKGHVEPIVASVPNEWLLGPSEADALIELIVDRAHYLCDNLERMLASSCQWQERLPTDVGMR